MTLSKEIKKTNELLDLLLQTIKRTNKITPMPPIQCVDERQKSKLLGSVSISLIIVEPVVV